MQNQHEGCCKNRDHKHDGCCKGREHQHEDCHDAHQHETASCDSEHLHGRGCGRHGRGGGRRQRFFGHGELRLVILDILTRDASHGYELIKAIENLTGGNYTPSAGVIYPTLDFLQDQQFITISDEEGGRKKIAITERARNGLMKIANIWRIFRREQKHAVSVWSYVKIRR